MHNIQKCLRGNFSKIAVCVNNPKKLQHIRQKIQDTLTASEQSQIVLITADEIPTLFTAPQNKSDTATVMKGYRVKVKYDEGERATKDEIIKRIMAASKRT